MKIAVLLFAFLGGAIAQEPSSIPHLLILSSSNESTEEAYLKGRPLIVSKELSSEFRVPEGGPVQFVDAGGKVLKAGERLPKGGVRLLPTEVGLLELPLVAGMAPVAVVDLRAEKKKAAGEWKSVSRLALSRELPPELALSSESAAAETEAISIFVRGPSEALPSSVNLISESTEFRYLDRLQDVKLKATKCSNPQQGISCARSVAIRLVNDFVERNHPAIVHRSLVAEVGGKLRIRLAESAEKSLLVGAPDALEKDGPGRYRVRIRTRILNMQAGGPPAVGSSAEEAVSLISDELESTSRVWAQCGIVLGPRKDWDIEVVDPPTLAMLEVGCDQGRKASGGSLDFRLDGQRISLKTRRGETPLIVAGRLAENIRKKGFEVELYRNAQVAQQALQTYDLLVRDRHGKAPQITALTGHELSHDPSMALCSGRLELDDGLQHFTDFDAGAGTREERMLIRGLSDNDPTNIELFVVPFFAGQGRIGESFIESYGGSIQSVLILDRGGVKSSASSFTLAHELGHVLLQMPGHHDDFGVDTPSSLMDADAADASIFGPRRLSLNDCRRALKQSGKASPRPLLEDWPLP